MNILHIAKIEQSCFKGVCVAVPSHILTQDKEANVAFININNIKIPEIKNQIPYLKPFKIENVKSAWGTPDLVVFHEIYRIEFIQMKNELKKAGIPYIIIPHGAITKNAQKKSRFKKLVANALLFDSFIKDAFSIQFLSEQEMVTSIGREKGFIGTNGINIPKKQKEAFNDDVIKLLFIGRIDVFYKGLDLLIEAVSEIKAFMEKHNVTLSLFGPDDDGGHKVTGEMIKKHGLSEIVTLSQGISGEEKEKELLNADIFIQTSRSEGMPTGILEALSYGLPCIVTTGTTLGDKINEYDAGWVADGDKYSIKESIMRAVSEKEKLKSKSNSARKLAENEFSWRKITFDTMKKYKEIVLR